MLRLDWVVVEERWTVDPRMLPSGQVFHYSIPVFDLIGDGRMESVDDIGSGKLLLRGGEVLISKLNPRLPRVLEAKSHDVPTVASTEFIALRPGPDVDASFFRYWLGCEVVKQSLDGATMSVTRSQQRVRPDILTKMWVSLPPHGTQRAIANYLDTETARIDALIEKKHRMVKFLEEQFSATAEVVIWSQVERDVPLMYLTAPGRPIMYGIVLPGPDVSDGVPIVKGGDVASRRLFPELLNRTTREIEFPYARARLAANDLVFAIRGGIGDVEIVPPELSGANITQDVARVSPAPHIDPRWLRFALRTLTVKQQVAQRITGATIKGLNIWDLKRIRVPASTTYRRSTDTDRLIDAERRFYRLRSALGQQVRLLAEHRQALITAAVTGELDVPGMAA